jgi:hypothetical protein
MQWETAISEFQEFQNFTHIFRAPKVGGAGEILKF